jgi:L-threonylcarbamoyladenylate synthase
MHDLDAATRAIEDGGLVVYPTETVYGLGADALDPVAIEQVFTAKGRSRDDPLSMGVPSVGAALVHTAASDVARACMEAFLPGPVTVICERGPTVPDVLTGGRDRVGIRIPDHDIALDLLGRAGAITATSANCSGAGSVTRPDDLDPSIREAAAVVLDGGETPGAESTVVDPERGEIHRRGAMADAVEAWLAERR